MAENRLTRELQTRDTEQRVTQWTPPSLLPDPNPQPGKVFRWIRASLVNQNDPANLSSRFREGFTPVKASDHPEIMAQADPNSRFKDNIEIGGLILCSAPEELLAQRKDHYERQTHQQMQAVDNSFMRTEDKRMPLFSERKTTVSFGRGKPNT